MTAMTLDASAQPRRLPQWLVVPAILIVAYGIIPAIGTSYLFEAILLPFLALSLAALGLNILTGYAGQVSLGSAAFMAVGAFAAYNFNLRVPGLPLIVSLILAGTTAAAFGILFGLPSLRLRGFYLAVSTLAAQFFVTWVLTRFGWLSNYNSSGVIDAPPLTLFGLRIVLHHRRRRLLMGVCLSSYGRAGRLQSRSFLLDPLHHHHWRLGVDPRRLFRRGLDRGLSARALAPGCAGFRRPVRFRHP